LASSSAKAAAAALRLRWTFVFTSASLAAGPFERGYGPEGALRLMALLRPVVALRSVALGQGRCAFPTVVVALSTAEAEPDSRAEAGLPAAHGQNAG